MERKNVAYVLPIIHTWDFLKCDIMTHLKIINHMYEKGLAMQSRSNWSITKVWRAYWMLYGNKMEQ